MYGEVGFGTTAPIDRLQISSASTSQTGTDLTNKSGSASWVGIAGQSAASNGIEVYGIATGSGMGGYFTSATGPALITGSGNVGIGTTSPAMAADISGNSAVSNGIGLRLLNGAGTNTNQWYLGTGGNTVASSAFSIGDNSAYRLVINSSGNVGIGTTAPAANLDVNGSIKSPMWKATQLMNSTPGGLPLTSASFTTGGGTLMIFASGAGYAATLQQIGMSVAIDNVVKGFARSFTNETSSHKAFAANAILVTGIAAGSHTITLSAWTNTVTNFDDFFSVTVLELPF